MFGSNGYSVGDEDTATTGGVMRIDASTLNLNDCRFKRNQADRGGVIQALGGASIVAMGCSFSDNKGILGGVLVLNTFANAHFESTSFEGNKADFGAVVLYFGGGQIRFADCTILQNEAENDGGVAYMSTSSGAIVEFTSSKIDSNRASSGSGGVLYGSSDAIAIISKTEVLNNEAGNQGGAIFLDVSSAVTLEDCSFASNKAHFVPTITDELSGLASGDHIYLNSTDSAVVNCASGNNEFVDPSADTGVIYFDENAACT